MIDLTTRMSRPPLKSSNPFEFEEEDDFVYVPKEDGKTPFDDKRQRMQHMVHASEDRQLESTQRALASIYESEAMGTATAEELLRQKEVLNNIERKTDEINSTLTVSQRHINNIKSVFGGVKNWWQGKKDTTQSQAERREASPLDKFVKKDNAETGSSGGQAGGDSYESGGESGYGGRGVRDADLDSRFMAGASSSQYRPSGSGLQYVQPITRSAREEELDRNLGMMSDGMGRLKMLALGLGGEIEAQNEQLDRITPKVDRSNDLLENQNRQMGRILKR